MRTATELLLTEKSYYGVKRKNPRDIYKYINKTDEKKQITLEHDIINNCYVFTFPLKNSKFSYMSFHSSVNDAEIYMENIIKSYI